MRILLEVSPLNVGGPQSWVCDIAGALARRGLSVSVLSFELASPQDAVCQKRLEDDGVPTRRLVLAGSWRQKCALLREAFRGEGHCDIAHFNSDVFSGLLLPFASSIPVRIVHARTPNWTVHGPGIKNALLHRLFLWQARRGCTHAFGVTSQALACVTGRGDRFQRPTEVVPSAIRSARYAPFLAMRQARPPARHPASLTLGFVGRLTASKNPGFLVTVLEQLVARGGDAHLVYLGAGPEEAAIRCLATELGLQDRIVWLAPSGQVGETLTSHMDILLLPSDFEGTPRVVLEAQACGVPVLCSTTIPADVGVVPELFHQAHRNEGAAVWADRAIQAAAVTIDAAMVTNRFAVSPCDIENQADWLIDRYLHYLREAGYPPEPSPHNAPCTISA